ncbi:MAG: hypothetical protein L0215_10070 [Gemmataceae bacterium]|nr:hypothetical protein [Gemmataceae bacterium]
MAKTLLGAFAGWVLGTILGCALAFAFHSNEPAQSVGTRTLGSWLTGMPVQGRADPRGTSWVIMDGLQGEERSNLNAFLFHGILFGGGFGALIFALAAATYVLARTMKEQRKPIPSTLPSSPPSQNPD